MLSIAYTYSLHALQPSAVVMASLFAALAFIQQNAEDQGVLQTILGYVREAELQAPKQSATAAAAGAMAAAGGGRLLKRPT